jgi:signal transduction histidine kinase
MKNAQDKDGADRLVESAALRRQISDLEKLQLLGKLVSGITHEINTPMHYLENNLTFLKASFKDLFRLYERYRHLLCSIRKGEKPDEMAWSDLEQLVTEVEPDYLHEEINEALSQSIEGIDMVSKIVLALKDFSHPALHEFSLTDINKCVDTVCTISRHEWKRVADLRLDLADDLPLLLCSRDEIHQVLLNLFVNAAHAIKAKVESGVYDRGLITVCTRSCGDKAEIRIRDDGTGIRAEHQPQIFSAHFTTRAPGQGTGLGLSLVREIVEVRHAGQISFTSKDGIGTEFVVVLPHRKDDTGERT